MASGEQEIMKTIPLLLQTLSFAIVFSLLKGDNFCFFTTLATLILLGFVLLLAKLICHSSFKGDSNVSKLELIMKSFNWSGEKLMNSNKVTGEKMKNEHVDGNIVKGELSKLREEMKRIVEEAELKAQENYKEKLLENVKEFEKQKSMLEDKYNEDRREWEEERKLLKKKYEEMRWT